MSTSLGHLDLIRILAELRTVLNGTELHFFQFIFLEMQFLRSVISGSRAMRVLPSIGPVAETHTVLAENSMFDFPDNTKSAIFGMGCFWGVERLFYNQKGIYSTQCK